MKDGVKVLFHLKRTETKPDGSCPVLGRITVGGTTVQSGNGLAGRESQDYTCRTTVQFRTKLYVDPGKWDARAGRVRGKSDEAVQVNERLNRVNALIFLRYEELMAQKGKTTAREVKNAFQGIASCIDSLCEYFATHNERYAKRVGVDRTEGTWTTCCNSLNNIRRFIKTKYRLEDIPFGSLAPSFIDELDSWLRYERKLASGTISQIVWPLQKVVRDAMSEGLLIGNPFAHYEHRRETPPVKHLSEEELRRVMNTPLPRRTLCLTRDMFVLACFTGLSYSDMRSLTAENLQSEPDGTVWIRTIRQKTGVECNIPLLDIPLGIIEKYRPYARVNSNSNGNILLLPVPGNDTMNRHLKEIAAVCGVNINLTVHKARHTFASEVALSNGVSLESVSCLLGHTNVRTTQIYAKVTDDKIDRDITAATETIVERFRITL
ncbi:MAG: site-specific integrase [Rikenellaceae bacterium]|jgi:integrase|nr:site-specific integrase [Rikenellaceae bacterium]